MEGNNIRSFENLCKIFEMRIKLDKEKKVKTPSDVLINYEKYAKKIDNIYNEEFEKEVRPLITPSKTIEEEKDRLEKLIKLLEDRLEKRNDLEDRYYLATGDYISGLQIVISDKELDEKRERLGLINRYLETTSEIESVHDSIAKLKVMLSEEEEKKEDYKGKNQIMEDDLYSEFMKVIKEDNTYNNITEDNIDEELNNIKSLVKDSKETLDVTRDSVKNLITSGLEDDYSSYVDEAEKSYFVIKNKELFLKLYKLVNTFEDDFNGIFTKRDNIKEILDERKNLREDLSITDIDELLSFEKKVLEQISVIDNEKEVLDNISNYTSRIEFKESRLDELENDNNSVEILAILREFNLIDTYDSDEYGSEEEATEDTSDETKEEVKEEEAQVEEEPIVKEVIDPYRIKEVIDAPLTLNLGLAKLKGEAVREKVNKKLNPKPVSFDEILSDTKKEEPRVEIPKEEEKKEDTPVTPMWEMPKLEVPSIPEEPKVDTPNEEVKKEDIPVTPMWEMPKWEEPEQAEPKVEPPVWNIPTSSENMKKDKVESAVPLWEDIKPKLEDNTSNNLDTNINIFDNSTTNNNINTTDNSSSFWTPASDEKMETSFFPNINIPISDGLSSNDNFGFPKINNN